MQKNSRSEIAAFPALFQDLDQFIEEQASHARRTGTALAIALASGSSLLAFALQRAG